MDVAAGMSERKSGKGQWLNESRAQRGRGEVIPDPREWQNAKYNTEPKMHCQGKVRKHVHGWMSAQYNCVE